METLHAHDSPLAAYLEGEGTFVEPDLIGIDESRSEDASHPAPSSKPKPARKSFAPPSRLQLHPRLRIPPSLPPSAVVHVPQSALTRIHHAWSSAVNSRLGASDNAKFLEHFRYTIVASQLLNEYLDHGSLNPVSTPLLPSLGVEGTSDVLEEPRDNANLVGALSAAALAFALVLLIDWLRARRMSKSKVLLVLTALAIAAFIAYAYLRRQWLQSLRRQVVQTATRLTTNWQAYELSSSSALSLIQEVELVSKGYRLSTPLPPATRIEENSPARRCSKLRAALHKAYAGTIPKCIEACAALRALIDDDDLEKYFEIYDISPQDAREASGTSSLCILEDDPESLKSLRVLSYRSGVLRRVTLCSLMALEADGGKADFRRWRVATAVMDKLSRSIACSTERVRKLLTDMENFNLPSPAKFANTAVREKMRGQVRKISALGTGIRGLQTKMQILREETNNSIEQSDDLTDLGPTLMAQYEAIGADLKELLQAWETGQQSLQNNITRHEHRISLASSGLRSPVSSLGGLTAVEEVEGSPADALKVLNGDSSGSRSNRSSLNTSNNSDEELVFEAVALPRQRATTLTREERIAKMHEERAKQADLRAKRDANTSMLRELESVINLRPKKTAANGNGSARVTSL
ncbi:uncharacterized protein MYCFIDRAFT_50883 [Pseudocercospora fijiensis CIRAD86]|uniref:Vezatin n=1 Tax=Pseudocercospora fijiensis (strain CIRAD86) TaxID=383855 RepID=M3APD4_PSEFD|nr:uncharacterized protein MYCFIDRAFT_50883 [Pseudocercospora fijiensis CIRAD86]EME79277.1 hypothetical protein MYCFIDRAFT_50883 [Pseudocercospora fijiensis CIRAD86]